MSINGLLNGNMTYDPLTKKVTVRGRHGNIYQKDISSYYSYDNLERAKEVANNWVNSGDALEVEIYDSKVMRPIFLMFTYIIYFFRFIFF